MASDNNTHLFVYGTLKKGERNHGEYFKDSDFIGTAVTAESIYTMRDKDDDPGDGDSRFYPAVFHDAGGSRIEGEVYAVNQQTLDILDQIEEVGILYERRSIVLQNGNRAEMYIHLGAPSAKGRTSARIYHNNENGALSWHSKPRKDLELYQPRDPQTLIASSHAIIIKIGSALLVGVDGGIKNAWLSSLVEDVVTLRAQGKDVIVVTSGSIALGRKSLGISAKDRPSSIPLELKQGAAAVGQIALMEAYMKAFAVHGAQVAQILLTPSDTENRRSHLNARATIQTLLENKLVPIINENDTVSTSEIRFGDNDRLASRVAQMIGADLVIQLSTTDGLYTADPRLDPAAEHVPVVEKITAKYTDMAGDAIAGVSTGGMKSKMEAAKIATDSGVHMMIAKGTENHALKSVMDGNARATIFLASDQPRTARKKWILAHVKPKGGLILDEGACKALLAGKSLLPAGVKKVEGTFDRGDAVKICDAKGQTLGIGLVTYDSVHTGQIAGHKSADIAEILGYSRGDELIHRDDLVLNG